MRLWVIVFAILAFATGLPAAYFWYRSSQLQALPTYDMFGKGNFEPVQESDRSWICGLLEITRQSGNLNQKAAILTALSVLFSSVSSVISVFVS